MATTLDINIFKVIDAGHFWAHPLAQPEFMGKLNDHFRNSTTSDIFKPLAKGQMCVVRRTSDKCWYRARVINVLQTLSGPQASVYLVDLAESTLIPCCWVREVPAEFQNIPFQAMECFLTGLKPLALVTAYFDLTTAKQESDRWDEAATNLFKTLVQGCKLQVTVQNQDEKGRYHVLLMADNDLSQVCINDELVISGFATYFSDTVNTSSMNPVKAAKLQAINEKFQKQGSEVIKNLKEYISHGKFTSSEHSNSSDDELVNRARYNHWSVSSGESPLNVLRRHMSGSYGVENGDLSEPSARIPKGASQVAALVPSAHNGYSNGLGNESVYRRTDTLSGDENSGRVRFLSSRLPATGSGSVRGYSSIPSKSPADSSNLKPILKKRSPHGATHQSSGSSSEVEDMYLRKRKQWDDEDSRLSHSEISELANGNEGISLREKRKKEPSATFNAINVDALFSDLRQTSGDAILSQRAEPLMQNNIEPIREENSQQRISSVIEPLRSAVEKHHHGRLPDSGSAKYAVQPLPQNSVPESYDLTQPQSFLKKEQQNLMVMNNSSVTSSVKPLLPSEMLLPKSPSSPSQLACGKKISFADGVLIQTEGAPAPKAVFSLEHSLFAPYLRKLNLSSLSLIQAHAWPAIARGRDIVGVCSANEVASLAYLVPIIHQLVEERALYADLPSSSGPKLLILVPTWHRGEKIYFLCTQILARNRDIRVQLIFAGGAEESQVIQLINGCEILIATPPCFLRMLRKGYVNMNRLCHTVFNDADLMVEDFTSEIKDIMRHYAKLLKSQPDRLAPRQAVVMASSWSPGVASLVKAYLGNPVLIISDMMEAAIYRNVQQIVTVCHDSQRDVPLLGYIESFISTKEDTKDICVFTSTTSEAETVEEILKANCYFTLIAHEFLQPQELASVKRQWNTPHSSDASPILVTTILYTYLTKSMFNLVMTDGVIDQMSITNASCVIHYSIPTSKSKLCRRLTTMAGTFTSSEDHGCMSVIFVTDKCRPELPAIFAQLVKRSGQEVPQSLQDMVAVITAQEAERKELCYDLKSFGTCRFKALDKHCKMRHTVSAILDKPSPCIPTSGIVKVLILSVESTSCYWVRILEHKPADSQQAGTHSHTADSTDFLELTMSISGWFADPSHRVKHEQVSVGDLCAVTTAGKPFQRVKICYISGKEPHSNKPQYVEIRYVDKGDFEKDVHVDRLLQLPPHLHSCPFQAVEVFACRLQPLDKDLEWTTKANYFVKHLIEGKEMEGRVVLSLGNTMWLDPLVERHHLKNINVTTNLLNIRMELLKEKFASDNKQHVKLLRNLCEGVVDLSSLETGATGLVENSSEQCSALETEVLPEEGFHAVYVSAVRNPSLFFVQLKSSEDSLEDLEQRINSGVGTVDVEEGEISIGSLCVAKFSEDDKWYRARVMGSRPDNEYDVFFVDFGDQEWVTVDRIVPAWSSILQLPLQAIECSLVNLQPLENDWSDRSSNAFWEMIHELELFAKVKSKSPSLVSGSHRFVIELYDTSTEHDVIVSYEMVADGFAQTSPEGNKMLFPYSNGETQDHQFPYQRIPDMCLDVHQCRDPKQKVEIVKEIQTVVLNSESYKDDIRECGGVQGLCCLLSLNRDPFVLQHILTSLASLAFDNERNCEEIRNQRGLEAMCYLLGKCEDSAVQESLAWALQNVAATERNQNEASKRGGIKALCALLKTVSDDRVQERVTWAIGSLVKDHTSNCQAVQDCGGLKTLCELTAVTESENVLERAVWTLGMLATDLKNRNFIRQYGGIESICKRLQTSPSEQIIKQGALTLKTLAANSQYNRDVMSRLGMVVTLRSFMTDELQKLGIISRRVCWDLLQRLLGSAADVFEGASPQPHLPITRTQGISSSPGSVQKQGAEMRMVNGLGDSDDDEDLPPLGGGEDSDKENENALATTPTSLAKKSAKSSVKQSSLRQPQNNPSARPIIQARPITLEEENFVPFRVHPKTVWSQTRDLVRVCVKLRDVKREHAYSEITASRLKFRTQMGRTLYELDLDLFEDVDHLHSDSKLHVRGSEVQINLRKINHAVWTRLVKSKDKNSWMRDLGLDKPQDKVKRLQAKVQERRVTVDNELIFFTPYAPQLPYVSIDFDRWEVWSSSEEDEEDEGTRAAPTNLNSIRRESEDNGDTKQVLLPEMIVSDSSDSDDEASYSSGVDCLNFN